MGSPDMNVRFFLFAPNSLPLSNGCKRPRNRTPHVIGHPDPEHVTPRGASEPYHLQTTSSSFGLTAGIQPPILTTRAPVSL